MELQRGFNDGFDADALNQDLAQTLLLSSDSDQAMKQWYIEKLEQFPQRAASLQNLLIIRFHQRITVTNSYNQTINGDGNNANQDVQGSTINQVSGGAQSVQLASGAREIAADLLTPDQQKQVLPIIEKLEAAVAAGDKKESDTILATLETLTKSFSAAATGIYYACKIYAGLP